MAVSALPVLQSGGGSTGALGMVLLAGFAIYLFLEWRGIDPEAALAGFLGDAESGVFGVATSINGLLIGGLTLFSALVVAGVLDLPAEWGIQLVVLLELVAFALLLRELNAFDPVLYALVATGTLLIGLSAAGEPVLGALLNSPVGIILAIGAGYLVWDWWQSRDRQPIEIVGRVRRGGNNE